VNPDFFRAWRAADRAATAAEKSARADLIRAITGAGHAPAPVELNRAKCLRGAANHLFQVAMAQMEAQAKALDRAAPRLMSWDNLESVKVNAGPSGKLPGLEALGITPSSLSAIAATYIGSGH
jgi:hypothetical protein